MKPKPLIALPKEIVIPLTDKQSHFAAQRCHVKVIDNTGGPYLELTGHNDEPDTEESEHGIVLDGNQIDEFCAILKRIYSDSLTEYNK